MQYNDQIHKKIASGYSFKKTNNVLMKDDHISKIDEINTEINKFLTDRKREIIDKLKIIKFTYLQFVEQRGVDFL